VGTRRHAARRAFTEALGIEPNEAVSCAGVVDDAGGRVVVELARLLPPVG
jgi:predicted NUDIX family NTP pyrophosphohydrolase